MIGKTILHYKILEKIGQGGMGVVYKAEDTKLKRKVAIKFLPYQITASTEDKERFKIEAQTAAALNHPNIATIHAIEEAPTLIDPTANEESQGDTFIVMEYIEGLELKERIAANPLPIDEALNIALQVAEGLKIAHKNGIIHRDIKPANIIVTNHNEVKILDFGLAKLAGEARLTRTGQTIGTAAYMSPEQIQAKEVDHRSDIFSWGVVFYEMLTGQLPFPADYESALMYAILHEDPESLRSLNPKVPEEFELIINKALAKEPHRRYEQTDELVEDLQVLSRQLHSNRGSGSLTLHAGSEVADRGRGRARTRAGRLVTLNKQKIAGALLAAVLLILATAILFPSSRHVLSRLLDIEGMPVAKHIAVLSFTNIGGDPANQALCDGLVETLTSKLSQIEQFQGSLWVVPASEVRKNNVTSAGEALQLFGANLVLTGSVQRFNNLLRLTMNLIDAETLRQLASQMIDDPMTSVSVLQDEAVAKLAGMLNVQLKPQTRRVLRAGATTVPGAYEFYLQGRGMLQNHDQIENIDASLDLFKRAINADPNYALAYAGIGEAYLRKFQATKEVQWVKHAEENCLRAIELDNLIAPVHVTHGLLYLETGQYQEALNEFQKALELDSHNADAYRGRAKAFMALGQLEEAEATYKKSISIKPDYWGGYNDLGVFYFQKGRFEEAIAQFKHVIDLTPQNAKGYRNLGAMYSSLNRSEEAINAYNKALEIKPSYSIYSNLATLYFHQGKYKDAARMYEKALEIRNTDYRVWGYLATAYQNNPDDRDKAKEAHRQAIKKAEEILKVNPNNTVVLSSLAGYYVEFNENDKSLSLLQQVVQLNPKDVTVLYRIGYIYEQLNKREQALKWIGKALSNGYSLEKMENSPELADLRTDVRFKRLVKKLNLNTIN